MRCRRDRSSQDTGNLGLVIEVLTRYFHIPNSTSELITDCNLFFFLRSFSSVELEYKAWKKTDPVFS